jgi:hypothetical protein
LLNAAHPRAARASLLSRTRGQGHLRGVFCLSHVLDQPKRAANVSAAAFHCRVKSGRRLPCAGALGSDGNRKSKCRAALWKRIAKAGLPPHRGRALFKINTDRRESERTKGPNDLDRSTLRKHSPSITDRLPPSTFQRPVGRRVDRGRVELANRAGSSQNRLRGPGHDSAAGTVFSLPTRTKKSRLAENLYANPEHHQEGDRSDGGIHT